jgi:hypothetical protein
MFDKDKQNQLNQDALANPQPGDYWHEMFCPYFLVVHVAGDDITVLSCIGGSNIKASVDHGDGTWSFDYSKSQVVNRDWISDLVLYKSIPGFVADVVRTELSLATVTEWRDHQSQMLLDQVAEAQAAWEKFTGWSAVNYCGPEGHAASCFADTS